MLLLSHEDDHVAGVENGHAATSIGAAGDEDEKSGKRPSAAAQTPVGAVASNIKLLSGTALSFSVSFAFLNLVLI